MGEKEHYKTPETCGEPTPIHCQIVYCFRLCFEDIHMNAESPTTKEKAQSLLVSIGFMHCWSAVASALNHGSICANMGEGNSMCLLWCSEL